MVFNGIEAIQQLAADVGAKSFVIHEKGIKSRALRQRSVGTTNKVKSELGNFANVPEYQNGHFFVSFFVSCFVSCVLRHCFVSCFVSS